MDINSLLRFNIEKNEKIIDKILLSKESNISLYIGKSGAIIYLLELYLITQNLNLLKKTEEVTHTSILQYKKENKENFGFFGGSSGLCYSLIRVFETTNNPFYINQAIVIAKDIKSLIDSSTGEIPIEIFNGISGYLLTLLYLHKAGVKEEWLLDEIRKHVDYIISEAKLGNELGVYWDKTTFVDKGLTGFSHGVSGIGFVLYELFRLSGIDGLEYLAYQAFDYENSFFDKENFNWPDYRSRLPVEKFDDNYVGRHNNMTAWCHGAPGILLSRENTEYQQPYVEEIVSKILEKIEKRSDSSNFSICHSDVGNLLVLMSLNSIPSSCLEKVIYTLCVRLITFYEEKGIFSYHNTGEEYHKSLFLGEIGALYFILKSYEFLTKNKIKYNVLHPDLKDVDTYSILLKTKLRSYNSDYIKHNIIKNHYPKTILCLEKEGLDDFSIGDNIEKSFLEKGAHLLNDQVKDAFNFDSIVRLAEKGIKSLAYCHYKKLADSETINKYSKEGLLRINIRINKEVKLTYSKWDWNSIFTINDIDNKCYPTKYFIVPSTNTKIFDAKEIHEKIFNFVKNTNNCSIERVVNYILPMFPSEEIDSDKVEMLIVKNISSLIYVGILKINSPVENENRKLN